MVKLLFINKQHALPIINYKFALYCTNLYRIQSYHAIFHLFSNMPLNHFIVMLCIYVGYLSKWEAMLWICLLFKVIWNKMSCSIAMTTGSGDLFPETNINPATAYGNVFGRTAMKMTMTKTLSSVAAAAAALRAVGQRSPVTDSLFGTGLQCIHFTLFHSAHSTWVYTQPEAQHTTQTPPHPAPTYIRSHD